VSPLLALYRTRKLRRLCPYSPKLLEVGVFLGSTVLASKGRRPFVAAATWSVAASLVAPTAQAAVQEGRVAARNVLAAIVGREDELEKFQYRPLGQLVELGSRFAVNEVMGVRFSGFAAALFWRAVYLSKLEGPQNRARVAADWILGLLFRPAATEIRDLV
jgi:NADH dehydrogenase